MPAGIEKKVFEIISGSKIPTRNPMKEIKREISAPLVPLSRIQCRARKQFVKEFLREYDWYKQAAHLSEACETLRVFRTSGKWFNLRARLKRQGLVIFSCCGWILHTDDIYKTSLAALWQEKQYFW